MQRFGLSGLDALNFGSAARTATSIRKGLSSAVGKASKAAQTGFRGGVSKWSFNLHQKLCT